MFQSLHELAGSHAALSQYSNVLWEVSREEEFTVHLQLNLMGIPHHTAVKVFLTKPSEFKSDLERSHPVKIAKH